MSPLLQMPSVGAATGGSGGRLLELPLRRGVRAVPVQRGRERARSREVGDVALDVAVAAQELAEELPVVAPQQLLRDALELEQELVPRLLALLDRPLAQRRRMGDRQRDEALDARGNEAASAHATAAPQSWPTTCARSISSASRTATTSATLCRIA